MKKSIMLFMMLLIMIPSSNLVAQQDPDVEKVKSALENLFMLSKSKNFIEAAKVMLYTGDDSKRNLKDTYNPDVKSELDQVKRICNKIRAFLDLSDKYELGELKRTNNPGGAFYNLDVIFKSGSQSLKTQFSFLNLNGKILLTDVK